MDFWDFMNIDDIVEIVEITNSWCIFEITTKPNIVVEYWNFQSTIGYVIFMVQAILPD